MFQWSIKWISRVQRVFKGLMNVSRKFSGCFKEVLRVVQGRLGGDFRVSGFLKEVQRVLKGS